MTQVQTQVQPWPRFKTYSGAQLRRIALPLGGIGTGTISLGGRGDLHDWELVNRPAKGFSPQACFLALRTETASGNVFARVLEGPIPVEDYEGGFGAPTPNAGYPRFASAKFHAAYPLGEVELHDSDFPLNVSLQAFNPFVPGEADASGHAVAVLRVRLHNPSSEPVRASVCANLKNWLGQDGSKSEKSRNRNTWRDETGVRGLFGRSETLHETSPLFGTLALGVLSDDQLSDDQDDVAVSHREAWAALSWGDTKLDFWDDFIGDGRLDAREIGDEQTPTASLCVEAEVAAGQSRDITFLLAWHFPNRQTWTPATQENACCDGETCDSSTNTIGNYYTTQSLDAWDALAKCAAQLPELEAKTVAFARAFYDADLPDVVKEAAGFNVSTLRSPTVFRTPDGKMFGWEGCGDHDGCCHGTCTHVWNYEYATPFLFADLSRSMREVEFCHATDARGLMTFRVSLPLDREATHLVGEATTQEHIAAADGQMGCLVKLYRDWKLCGDDSFLHELWPGAKRALEFCWIENGWDADRDGVMEGCQHNTMDVEYFGPNPQMQTWYLAALRACEEMARFLDDQEFAQTCRELFERGRAWTDAHLWNGDYYEHEIRPPVRNKEWRTENAELQNASSNSPFSIPNSPFLIAPGLLLGMGAKNLEEPELQLGAGCLVDQLVGAVAAQVCELGDVLDSAHVRATLHSILKYNTRENLRSHFNHLRTFALGDESALLMASYPKGRRPARPFPYYNEVMTGFEHTVAAHLLFLGERGAGLQVLQDIRARYDGRSRNPFNEAECGHHYARAMASWASVLALTGFAWDAHSGTLTFHAATSPATWFWSNGQAWGTISQKPRDGEIEVELRVLCGELALRRIILRDWGEVEARGAGEFVVKRA